MAEPKDLGALDYLLDRGPASKTARVAQTAQTEGQVSSAVQGEPSGDAADIVHGLAAHQMLQTCASIEQEGTSDGVGALLSEIDARIKLGAELLVPVTRLLVSNGLLETVEARPFNDDRVRLTEEGHALLQPGKQVELLGRLGLGK